MSFTTVGYVLFVNTLDSESSAYPPVQNFIDLYENEAERITIIGPSGITLDHELVETVTIQRNSSSTAPFRVLTYLWYQFVLALTLFHARDQYDTMFFHVGGTTLLLPILACRLAGIPTNVFVIGSPGESYYETHGRSIVSTVMVQVLNGLERLSYRFADRILLLSTGMISADDKRLSSTECIPANPNYIDCEQFQRGPPANERPYDIIYVGRFERVKGILKLTRAVTQLVDRRPNLRVQLVGDGSLYDEIEQFLSKNGISDQVDLTGWVDHDQIPSNLAAARVLVLPSESEGVPTSMLEAMACGTVPIASPVGGIPAVISDGETGVLLPDNDPETIARTLDDVLDKDNLDAIGNHARDYIRQNHSYNTTAERFHSLLAADSEQMQDDAE